MTLYAYPLHIVILIIGAIFGAHYDGDRVSVLAAIGLLFLFVSYRHALSVKTNRPLYSFAFDLAVIPSAMFLTGLSVAALIDYAL